MKRRNLFKLGLATLFPLPVIKKERLMIVADEFDSLPSQPVKPLTIEDYLRQEAHRITCDLIKRDLNNPKYQFPKQ